jgi:hypothetical protein
MQMTFDSPPFPKALVNGASPKKPIEWKHIEHLPIQYHVALEDVVSGRSEPNSRMDLATLFNFMFAAKERKVIDDGGLLQCALQELGKAFRRTDDGKPFRLSGTGLQAMRDLVTAFEEVAKTISARDYMKTCNYVWNELVRNK